jgi:tRNA-2-methylthio-N6-dimethylallyladenosine synthase
MTQNILASSPADVAGPQTYSVTTYGCQMNVHDSERISGLLDTAG